MVEERPHMSTNESSLLARKIAAGRSKIDTFPALKEFGAEAAKSAAEAIGELLQGAVEATISDSGMTALSEALSEGADPGVYYTVMDDSGEMAALVSISPALSVLTMERLLGGDLGAPADNAESGQLDFRMAESLVDTVGAALNDLFRKDLETTVHIRPGGKKGARSPIEAIGDNATETVFKLEMEFTFDEIELSGAFAIYFPIRFIERLGLMRRRKSATTISKDSLWAKQLRQNILNCELPLPVVLFRYATSVGELSRLKVGQVVDLEPTALHALDITAVTDAGPVSLAHGRLGAYRRRKAVKLTTEIDKGFIRGL